MDSKFYLPGVSYFEQNGYVSNSQLGSFWDWLTGKQKMDLQAAYDFGNLLDGIMTEPGLVDVEKRTVKLAYGKLVSFTPELFAKAQRMQKDAYEDPTLKTVFGNMDFQYERYIDEFRITTEEADIILPIRIKMDGYAKRINTGMDLKSTVCTTQKAFIESLFHFNYDKQGALYMDGSGVDRFWFIGVGKVPLKTGKHPVFKFCFRRGDEFYLSGKTKYQRQAIAYHKLVYSLNTTLV